LLRWCECLSLEEAIICNLYSITANEASIIALFRVINRYVGNLPPMTGVFPDFPAPVIRNKSRRGGVLDLSSPIKQIEREIEIVEQGLVRLAGERWTEVAIYAAQ
jgi:hypothetical protein